MSSLKEIKTHMESVRETRKITNAMYLIASTKLQKARSELDHTRPYFESMQAEIKRIFRSAAEGVDSRYFYPEEGQQAVTGTYGCLVITADKGLAGAYNQNVLREAQHLLDQHPDTKLFERSFLYTAQNPTMARAREIGSLLLDGYDRGALKKIFVIYTDMESALSSQARSTRLLPFHRSYFAGSEKTEKAVREPFTFSPSVAKVLEAVVPSYMSGYIYSALVDSFCCEQNARMTAMDAATKNAEKLLGELSLQYDRVRQAAITQEITEISAGAKAQRLKHRKEA